MAARVVGLRNPSSSIRGAVRSAAKALAHEMISRSSEGGGSLPIVDYIGFMPIDLGAVNFDALLLPDISFEVPRAAVPAPVFWRKQRASAGPVSRSAGGFDREPRLRRPDGAPLSPGLPPGQALAHRTCARSPPSCSCSQLRAEAARSSVGPIPHRVTHGASDRMRLAGGRLPA